MRLIKIIHVLITYHIDDLLKELPYSWLFRLPLKFLPSYWVFYFCSHKKENSYTRFRLALIELGPIFIKLGQLLATRRDLLDDDLADELELLTENVPPFDSGLAIEIVEHELKGSVNTLFSKFEKEPIAAASIAQVHAAELKSGEQVVVKILRPNIEKIVKRDLLLMFYIASKIEAWIPYSRLFYLSDLVENYQNVILGEINLHREAANTIKFRKNALQHNFLYIPRVYLDFSTRTVMCSERIYGIPVNQSDAIQKQGTDLHKLAVNGVKIFFTQVFKDNFFHADMHPGNIFVNTVNPELNQYTAVDGAIAGTLSREDQLFLAQQLLALIQKNYSKNAQLLIEAGWVDKSIHKEELALRLQKIVEPIFDKAMSEIDFSQILLELLSMAREFHIKINPNFLLFQKTLIHIEGLGKQLYPELNVWEVGKPLMEEWVRELLSPKALANALKESTPQLVQQLPELPALLYSVLNQMKRGNLSSDQESLLRRLESIESRQNSKDRAWFLGVTLLGSAGIMASGLSIASIGTAPLFFAGLGFSVLAYQLLKK